MKVQTVSAKKYVGLRSAGIRAPGGGKARPSRCSCPRRARLRSSEVNVRPQCEPCMLVLNTGPWSDRASLGKCGFGGRRWDPARPRQARGSAVWAHVARRGHGRPVMPEGDPAGRGGTSSARGAGEAPGVETSRSPDGRCVPRNFR